MSSMVEAMGAVLFLYRPVAWCSYRGMKYLSILMVCVALLVGGCGEKTPIYPEGPTHYYVNGSKVYEAPLVDGQKHGTAIWYFEDGSTKTEKWVHGTGTHIKYRQDGSKEWEASFVNGKQHGTEIHYNEDGSSATWAKYETPWVNGKRHGTQIWYNEDGSKYCETPYVNGQKHGTAIWYHENGSKFREIVYVNDKEISEKKF